MIHLKVKGTKSWLDPKSQRALAFNLTERLWNRCRGRRGLFVTLTYRREEYDSPLDLYRTQSERQDVPLFIRKIERRLRVKLKGKWFRKMEFQRGGWVHWHLIILGIEKIPHDVCTELWGKGHVWLRRLNKKNVRYCCKYMSKGGGVPAFLLGEPARSIKVVSVSPGFWGDKSSDDVPGEADSAMGSRVRLPIWTPIGEKIEASRFNIVMHDDEGRYRTAKRCDLGALVITLLERGCRVQGGEYGWLSVDAEWSELESSVARAGDAQARLPGGEAALHLIGVRNPDADPVRGWLRAMLEELLTPQWAGGVS